LEKLKQDHERGITTKTSLTLPNVKLLPGGLSTLPTNNSGSNINDEESLNSILDLLNKTATDGCALVFISLNPNVKSKKKFVFNTAKICFDLQNPIHKGLIKSIWHS
jgi:hypothetical protein